ncbi:MAG: cell division protein SepF [Ruminococcaceae bacterium]|nr:cell division protein SepF [Oscillospiraceae bacterium]
MGFMDKFKNIVNPDENYEEEEYGYEGEEYETVEQQVPQANQTYGSASVGSALELKVVRPERFETVTQIADHLINNRTVVLNLEATNKETAKRMIDFLSGVAYSIEGNLKKVANNTFVITPGNVAVSNEQVAPQAAPQAAPQNVSEVIL